MTDKEREAFEAWRESLTAEKLRHLTAWQLVELAWQARAEFPPQSGAEVVERVAKALYANDPATTNSKPMTWEDCGEVFPERVEQCLNDARVAIAAMQGGNNG